MHAAEQTRVLFCTPPTEEGCDIVTTRLVSGLHRSALFLSPSPFGGTITRTRKDDAAQSRTQQHSVVRAQGYSKEAQQPRAVRLFQNRLDPILCFAATNKIRRERSPKHFLTPRDLSAACTPHTAGITIVAILSRRKQSWCFEVVGVLAAPGLPDRSICGMYLSLTRLPTGVRRSVDWHRHPRHFRGPKLAPCFASMMAGPWFLSVQRSGSATRKTNGGKRIRALRGSLARAIGYHLTDRHQAPPARVLGASKH